MGLVIAFLVLAIIFALLGFGAIASSIIGIAFILFWIFLAVLIVGLIFRLVSGHWWF